MKHYTGILDRQKNSGISSITKILFAFAAGLCLLMACNKKHTNEPLLEDSNNYAKADIHFITDNKKVSFSATKQGALAGIAENGNMVIMLYDEKTPMAFLLNIVDAKVGTFTHEDGTLRGGGVFFTDTLKGNLRQLYVIGEDNRGDQDGKVDGKMSLTITSITKDHIKGTFTTTMIQNSTIVEDGVIIEGAVKEAVATNGSFNCGRISSDQILQ